MANEFGFIPRISGLTASLTVTGKVPAMVPISWDFGDSKTDFNKRSVEHTYEKAGFYCVTVSYIDPTTSETHAYSKTLVINNQAKTSLTGSIYELIDYYLPTELAMDMSLDEKQVYIHKWQLYIGPLVNHEIPMEEYNNELYYEGLENQLIMELAVWDHLNTKLYDLLAKSGKYLSNLTNIGEGDGENGSRGDRIKQITTGPSEVQYYDEFTESISSLYSTYYKALQPGGVIDELKKTLCMLAERLEIWLPICQRVKKVMTPKVVNRRHAGPLGGPNPSMPVKGPGETLLG